MKRWSIVIVYAAAMAWVEAAVVYYLRVLIDRINPYQSNPLPNFGGLGEAEMVREFATLVMLASVAFLAGANRRTRAGYFLIAFGAWDIFYYGFLKIITGWPQTMWDWDILFLLPLPWWGPVLAPCLIAALMVVFGTLVTQFDSPAHPMRVSIGAWLIALGGIVIELYVFMQDAIHTIDASTYSIDVNLPMLMRQMLPSEFNWTLFLFGLALMCAPVIVLVKEIMLKSKFDVRLGVVHERQGGKS